MLASFDPWQIPEGSPSWALPATRLESAQARDLLERLNKESPGDGLARAVALLRQLRMSSEVGYGPEDEGRRELADIAAECSSRFVGDGRPAGPAPSLRAAVEAEMAVLGREMARLAGTEHSAPDFASRASIRELEDRTAQCEPKSYRSFVLGRMERIAGRMSKAARRLRAALDQEAGAPGRIAILLESLETRRRLGHVRVADAQTDRLLALCVPGAGNPAAQYETAMAHHHYALSFHHRRMWAETVEAARLANFHLFRFRASQSARRVGINYYLVAKGMFEQREWSEAGLLAGLSLRSLRSWSAWPTKAEAIMILANSKRRYGDKEGARKALEGLIHQCPDPPPQPEIVAEARLLAQRLKK